MKLKRDEKFEQRLAAALTAASEASSLAINPKAKFLYLPDYFDELENILQVYSNILSENFEDNTETVSTDYPMEEDDIASIMRKIRSYIVDETSLKKLKETDFKKRSEILMDTIETFENLNTMFNDHTAGKPISFKHSSRGKDLMLTGLILLGAVALIAVGIACLALSVYTPGLIAGWYSQAPLKIGLSIMGSLALVGSLAPLTAGTIKIAKTKKDDYKFSQNIKRFRKWSAEKHVEEKAYDMMATPGSAPSILQF